MRRAGGLRIGLIGAARIAVSAVIAPARTIPGAEVAGVAARDPARARAFAAAHRLPRTFGSYAELLADPDIDLAYIATPPATHAAIAMQAIAQRKPLLVEKPFACTADEARAVFDAARAADVPVFEAMHSLHHPLFARLLALLHSGELGAVTTICARCAAPIERDPADFRWSGELGGGALLDLGVYTLAWCRRIAGNGFRVIEGSATWLGDIDTSFRATLAFDSGAAAAIEGSMMAGRLDARLEIECEKGKITVENPLVPQQGHALHVQRGAARSVETVPGPGSYVAQLGAVRAALAGEAPFLLPAGDYVASMEALDRVRAALR